MTRMATRPAEAGELRALGWRALRSSRRDFLLLFVLVSLGSGMLKLLHSPRTHVRTVEVVGTHYLAPRVLMEDLELVGRSIFDLDPGKIAAQVERHPWVAAAEVRLRPPAKVEVAVRERVPVALWQKEKGYELVDSEGRELPLLPFQAALRIPVLTLNDSRLLLAAVHDLERIQWRFPLLYKRLTTFRYGEISEMQLDSLAPLVVLEPGSLDHELEKLSLLLQDQSPLDGETAVVDLRFGNKVITRKKSRL